MHVRRMRNDHASMRLFVEELWLPYLRELPGQRVADEGDVDVEDIVDFRTDHFDDPAKRLWVALDGVGDSRGPVHGLDATLTGFVSSTLSTPPQKFENPDRLRIGNFYVAPEYRGTGLADDLVARALRHGREDGAEELTLEVDTDNERALAYYEKLGLDVERYRMRVQLEDVELEERS
jgi:ribosomal protein S18 acetylase RimI-like enzyme